jgi:hypothetical protein
MVDCFGVLFTAKRSGAGTDGAIVYSRYVWPQRSPQCTDHDLWTVSNAATAPQTAQCAPNTASTIGDKSFHGWYATPSTLITQHVSLQLLQHAPIRLTLLNLANSRIPRSLPSQRYLDDDAFEVVHRPDDFHIWKSTSCREIKAEKTSLSHFGCQAYRIHWFVLRCTTRLMTSVNY